MLTYLLWFIFFAVIIFFGGVFMWTLKRQPAESEKDAADLEEWICPSCGFHVQMGKECIYCGEKKPEV